MRTSRRTSRAGKQVACGALAGPLFVAAFSAIGAGRKGYDWKRTRSAHWSIAAGFAWVSALSIRALTND